MGSLGVERGSVVEGRTRRVRWAGTGAGSMRSRLAMAARESLVAILTRPGAESLCFY